MDAGLGATSLVLELFEIATKAYGLFKCAARADIEVKTFVLRLKFEQARLSRWGEVVGLCPTSNSPTFARYLKTHESLVIDVLKHIKKVLDRLNELTTTYYGPSQKSGSSSDANITRTTDISGPLEQSSAVQVLYEELTEESRRNVALASLKHPRGLNHLFRLAEDVFVDVGIGSKFVIARQIADSLLYLHAVNWLHKGLRSAGIVFVGSASVLKEGLGRLLMSGIGFSGPSDNSFTSIGPPHDSKWFLYCHPGYLDSGRKNGYRKSYDIYSLGIILIEIAHWKPIDRILQSLRSGRDSALGEERQDTRARILDNDSVLKQVRLNMGPLYFEATRACIEGLTAFGLGSDVDESNPYVAAVLQRAFIEVVVDPLRNVRI